MGGQLAREQEQLKNMNCRWRELISLVTEKELQKLYKNFNKIDKDKNGTLSPEEFFDIPGRFKISENFEYFRAGIESTGQKGDCCSWQEQRREHLVLGIRTGASEFVSRFVLGRKTEVCILNLRY